MFVTGEMMRRLFELWVCRDVTYNEDCCVFDFTDSIEKYMKKLRKRAKNEHDEVLLMALDYLELAADKFEPLVDSIALACSAGVEMSYVSMVDDWLVSGQTKYPLVAVRQQQVLYMDLSSRQLHKQRSNRCVHLNRGKHHIAMDASEEHNNRLVNRAPRYLNMAKIILVNRFLALCIACKIFLDIYFKENMQMVEFEMDVEDGLTGEAPVNGVGAGCGLCINDSDVTLATEDSGSSALDGTPQCEAAQERLIRRVSRASTTLYLPERTLAVAPIVQSQTDGLTGEAPVNGDWTIGATARVRSSK
jgi:hypothetical protein